MLLKVKYDCDVRVANEVAKCAHSGQGDAGITSTF